MTFTATSSTQELAFQSNLVSGTSVYMGIDGLGAEPAATPIDLVTVKTLQSVNASPLEGDTVTYRLTVTNATAGSTATGVSLTDQLPAGLTFVSATPSAGTYDSATGVWTIGDVTDTTPVTLDISATVDAGQAGNTITNTTTAAAGNETDPGTTGDDLVEAVTVVAVADLVTVKTRTSSGTTLLEGDTISYEIKVTNNGPADATNVALVDLLPAQLTAAAGSGVVSQGSYVAATGAWTIGSLANGASATLVLSGTVNAGVAPFALVNTTTAAAGDQSDPSTSGDSLSVSAEVVYVISAVNDDFTGVPVNGTTGGSTASVHTNDSVNGGAVNPAVITTTVTNDGGSGITINSDGTLTVPPGTAGGTYSVTYQICDPSVSSKIGCSTATASVTVVVSPAGTTSCTGTNLVANSSFETPAFPSPGQVNPVSSITGWTVSGTTYIIDRGAFGFQPHTGDQIVAQEAGGTLQAAVSGFQPGAELRIHWASRGFSSGTNTATLTATDDGGGSQTSGPFTGSPTAWAVHSLTYPVSAGASSLSLQITSNPGSVINGYDTVEVCQTYITLAKAEGAHTDVDGSGHDSAGDTIAYTFTITNPAGNEIALTAVKIIDDKIGTIDVSTPAGGDADGDGLLDPGEAWTVTATYTLTQADINTGSVTNIAHAEASTGQNTISSSNAQVTANLPAQPGLSLSKTYTFVTDANGDGKAGKGDVIRYAYAVTNTGNVAMANVSVSDVTNGNDPAFLAGANPGQPVVVSLTNDAGTTGDSTDADNAGPAWDMLAPGDTITFTADYTVVQPDVDTLQ